MMTNLLGLKLLSHLKVLHGQVIIVKTDGSACTLQVQLGHARRQPDGLCEVRQGSSIVLHLLQHPVSAFGSGTSHKFAAERVFRLCNASRTVSK